MRKPTKISLIALAVVLALGGIALSLWWRQAVEQVITRNLAGRGIEAQFTLESAGLSGATLTHVQLGVWTAQKLELHYDWQEILKGRLQSLILTEVTLPLTGGLPFKSESAGPVQLPVTAEALQSLPVAVLQITDSTMNFTSDALAITAPFSLHMKRDKPQVALDISDATLSASDKLFHLDQLAVKAHLETKTQAHWAGTWEGAITLPPLHESLPPTLSGKGSLDVYQDYTQLRGKLHAPAPLWDIGWSARIPYTQPQHATLIIQHVQTEWRGGKIRLAEPLQLALSSTAPIRAHIAVDALPLQGLLDTLGEGKASGTGEVAGTVNVTVTRAGVFAALDGQLQAVGTGRLSLPATWFGGNTEVLQQVGTALADFHYERLSLTLRHVENRQMAMLSLEGRSPNAFEGRLLKFNVNLSGDLLQSVQQSIAPLQNPEQLIRSTP